MLITALKISLLPSKKTVPNQAIGRILENGSIFKYYCILNSFCKEKSKIVQLVRGFT
jgi:hypothetical protein